MVRKVKSDVYNVWTQTPEALPPDTKDRLFTQCFEQLTPLESNNVANLIEIANILKELPSLAVNLKEMMKNPPKANKAWLAWRYQVNTTAVDVKDHTQNLYSAINSLRKHLQGVQRKFHAREYLDDLHHIPTSVCLTVVMQPRLLNPLMYLWNALNFLGLQPNLVNLWDLVPLSFVVDWILPIGNKLSQKDFEFNYNEQTYSIVDATMSTKKTWTLVLPYGSYDFTYYRRGQANTQFKYAAEDYTPSGITTIKRIVDGVSMLCK